MSHVLEVAWQDAIHQHVVRGMQIEALLDLGVRSKVDMEERNGHEQHVEQGQGHPFGVQMKR